MKTAEGGMTMTELFRLMDETWIGEILIIKGENGVHGLLITEFSKEKGKEEFKFLPIEILILRKEEEITAILEKFSLFPEKIAQILKEFREEREGILKPLVKRAKWLKHTREEREKAYI